MTVFADESGERQSEKGKVGMGWTNHNVVTFEQPIITVTCTSVIGCHPTLWNYLQQAGSVMAMR